MDSPRLKRIYDPPDGADGHRVLVDRLWPRGVSKAEADLAEWAKDAAPSDALRKWYHAGAGDWPEFRRRYLRELAENPGATDALVARLRAGETVTLLYASRDESQNHALVLAEHLRGRLSARERG